ncbi:glycosyltransferase [Streptomyces sp. SLBN-31]|uniref:glycosyltransferase n=1 Tax=Streptomyces sp. SLBN-31 TaxID=2768444 RepID=UPI00114FA5F2|nr:glycosyltransferase [Streptomyces sp. SLBN-31]TQJ91466.1 glycosyltransferase involved in cell wall biosynthesis [Streptomyces sp. SLBN-31]
MTSPQRSSSRPPIPGRLLVAVSGPDDSGKTTLVGRVVATLRQEGCTVTRTYCYGCVMCRRFPGRPRSGRPTGPSSQRGTWFDAVHARIDASETALRLAGARVRAAVRRLALRRPCVILTDRGPLDSLAKFDPPAGSRTAALFRRLAGAYDLTLLLESHAGEEPACDAADARDPGRHWQERYRRWARSSADVVGLDARATTPALAADAAFRLMVARGNTSREQQPSADALDGPVPRARAQVVVSAFDTVQSTDYRGGGSVVIDHVARRLAQEFDVTVVTAATHGGTQVRDGLRYRFVPVCKAGPRAAQLLFQAVLPLVARRIPHDVWLENFTPPFTTGLLPLFARKPVIGINQCRCSDATWRKYHIPAFAIEHCALRRYRDLVVLNQADAAEARRHSPKAAVHLVENGVDQRHVEEDEFGSGGSILFLGRLDVKLKGLDLLLAAYAAAAPALPLIIAGHGTAAEERRVESLLAHTGANVRRLGFVASERKEQLLRESAFMVMPSRTEAFGLVALESMVHGKPVLHFDLPSLDWMEGKGNIGVPCFDVDRMAEEIGRLATDADLRRALGRQAYMAARHYTWEAMADRYLATVRDVLGSSAAARSSHRGR